MIKINRKPNGEILGLPVFLGKDIIEEFADNKTTHLEVTKIIVNKGVLLEFEAIEAIKT